MKTMRVTIGRVEALLSAFTLLDSKPEIKQKATEALALVQEIRQQLDEDNQTQVRLSGGN